MKILHLNSCRFFFPGLVKQLTYEENASKKIPGISWKIQVFHCDSPNLSFEKQYPKFFRGIFLRNLYAWVYLIKERSKYDIVLMRYIPFDPFVLICGWLVRNRVSIHHSKEVQELTLIKNNWKGKLASLLERLTGYINARQVKGFLGVTREIANYQLVQNKVECPAGYYPNGIEVERAQVLEDQRPPKDVHIAFICGAFAFWHGLDRLMDAILKFDAVDKSVQEHIYVHLIGKMQQDQEEYISKLNLERITIKCYGLVDSDDYHDILSICDVGLGSLALDRNNLKEASTLKVREYLALGLPVYSGFKDTAIPGDFPYFQVGPMKIEDILSFALRMKKVPRLQIRESATKFIQKEYIMRELCYWLQDNIMTSPK